MAVSITRREQAQQTKRRLCEAAKDLFLARGYGATTVTEIAKAAGVAQQTVYFSFGSKAALLAAVLDREIVGDEKPVPLLERPQVTRLGHIESAQRRLERIVTIAADITERLAPLYEIVRSGAADDDVRSLLDQHEAQRWQSLRAMVAEIDGHLAEGLQLDDAADLLYALLSHDVYWLLVCRRQWPPISWRQHVSTQAAGQLLRREQ